MRNIVLATCLVFFVPAAAHAATPAPSANQQVTISGWRLECDPGKTKLSCRVLNQITQSPSGALILGFMLNTTPEGKPRVTLQVPLEAAVAAPVIVSAGGGSQSFPYLTCSQQGCFATAVVENSLLAAMRNERAQLQIVYSLFDASLGSHNVTVTLPLNGFSELADKLK